MVDREERKLGARERALTLTLINHPRREVELLESDELSPPEEPASAIYDPSYLLTIIFFIQARRSINSLTMLLMWEYRDARKANV